MASTVVAVVRVDRGSLGEARDPREVGPQRVELRVDPHHAERGTDERGREDDRHQRARQRDHGHEQRDRQRLEDQRSVIGRGSAPARGEGRRMGCRTRILRAPAGTMGGPCVARPFSSAVSVSSPCCRSPSPAPPRPSVVVLKVEGAIDRPLLGYLDERLTSAEADGAVVVLQLDTSGTLGSGRGGARAAHRRHAGARDRSWVRPRRRPTRAAPGCCSCTRRRSRGSRRAPRRGRCDPIDLSHPDRTWPGLTETIEGWLDARGKDTSLGLGRPSADGAGGARPGLRHRRGARRCRTC